MHVPLRAIVAECPRTECLDSERFKSVYMIHGALRKYVQDRLTRAQSFGEARIRPGAAAAPMLAEAPLRIVSDADIDDAAAGNFDTVQES
jgi:hypothetical protein